ncbi:hypothetical protein Gohar_014040 [Gossypium harknessii]|uniref:poly(A)-specific ribonuclease n=1 Tax=Gossypium harknessii TaxID=34285 RepID=A0A7J9H4K1_9ROSI|nr:hypothetical protein [Gossypium harknessii]
MSISGNKSIVVRHVFAEDLDNELLMIKEAIFKHPFVSIDTEFLGTIIKPSKQVIHEGNPIINYHYMKLNVDVLQIIQLGLSLSDARVIDLIKLLKRQWIDFEKNKEKGIDSKDFAKKFWDYMLLFNCYDSYSKSTAFASSLVRASIGLFLRLQHFRAQTHLQVIGVARLFREDSSNIKRGSYY